MPLITSRQNDRVKQLRALRDRKARDATDSFFVEGARTVEIAIKLDARIELVVIAPERLTAADEALTTTLRDRGLDVLEVSGEIFDAIAYRPDGGAIGVVARQRWEELTDDTRWEDWLVALHDIQHPGNLGTLIRTTDASHGNGVILSGQTTDPYHPIAVRGSLGAVFSQRIIRATPESFTRWVKQSGATVIGTSPNTDLDYRKAKYATPMVIIGGNERIGIADWQIALCDQVVRIPMHGSVESLNLSVATALVLYEAMRQTRDL